MSSGVFRQRPEGSSATPALLCLGVTWLHGYMVTWLHGYMATWLHGYMVTWLHGCHIFGDLCWGLANRHIAALKKAIMAQSVIQAVRPQPPKVLAFVSVGTWAHPTRRAHAMNVG